MGIVMRDRDISEVGEDRIVTAVGRSTHSHLYCCYLYISIPFGYICIVSVAICALTVSLHVHLQSRYMYIYGVPTCALLVWRHVH